VVNRQAAADAQLDDRQIVDLCRRGVEAGFRALVSGHHDYVLRLCWRILGNREEALDVTQEVFIRAVRSVDRLDPQPSLRPWLRRVATNLSISASRHAGRLGPAPHAVSLETMESELTSDSDGVDPVGQLVELRDDVAAVHRLLSQLPPEQRAALMLRAGEGLPYGEIAAVLAMPVGTVKSHVSRARASLRRAMLSAAAGLVR
jgi:RNA polymerase sigma-70 factor (ECF subfamily)